VARRAAKGVAPDPNGAARARFLEQGSDPAIAKKALEDATSLSRGLWLSFLTFGTYLVITIAGVTHRDLLLETPITLPVLNAKLPLVTFFWVAPILFVIFHLYLLLSLKLLADQVHHYVDSLSESGLDEDAQDRARLQLPNFVVVQVLGGTSAQVNSWAGKLMRFTAFITLAAGPLIMLLFVQLMFLPFHSWPVTMSHRALVVVDLILIWYFWRAIKRPKRAVLEMRGYAVGSAIVLVLSLFGFMYPGERLYGVLPAALFRETNNFWLSPNKYGGLFANTLELRGQKFFEEINVAKAAGSRQKGNSETKGIEFTINLAGRDFANADMREIDLRWSNLTNTDFRGASLTGAYLEGANLSNSQLGESELIGASMRDATLVWASLQRAKLYGALLQGANLGDVRAQGANFSGASLQGASLGGAKLQSAMLQDTLLQGANLFGAGLQGAKIYNTSMRGANLTRVSLQGAELTSVRFDGALLEDVFVWRSSGCCNDMFPIEVPSYNESRLTVSEYESLTTEAVKDTSISVADFIRRRLSVLDPTIADSGEKFDWQSHRDSMTRSDYPKAMQEALLKVACEKEGAPYVAQGIASYRLEDIGREGLLLVEALLKGCPGTRGLRQESIEILMEMRTKLQASAPSNSDAAKPDAVESR
jgi:uncharacterized protein YjbI with pentapeptide repeats